MKPIIFGVIAFVLGLGGSTGALVFTAPAHSPLADSLAIAHARKDSTAAPHAEVAMVPTGSVPVPVPVTQRSDTAAAHEGTVEAAPATAEGAHAPAVTRVPPVAEAAHAERPSNAPDAESFKQVGSILLNMKPAEAAKIVSYLNDDQVEGLLRSMSPRQAAGVMGQLPAERAAALSRRLLVPSREAKP